MARPIKKGLDYFPLDVNWNKGSMEYLYSMYGILGVAVIKLSLEPRIYEGEGYYIKYDKRSSLTFSNEFGEQLNVISKDKNRWDIYDDVVNAAVDFGIFDANLYKKYSVLTSVDIQERYIRAKEKSQRVELDSRYLLLSDAQIPKNVEIIGVYGEKTGVSTPENTTKESKVKKSKVKYSKGEESKDVLSHRTPPPHKKQFGESGRVTLTEDEYMDLLSEFGEAVLAEYIGKMDTYLYENGKRYISCAAKLRQWIAEDKAHKGKKPRGFNNYTDSNKPDYSNFSQKILEEMLSDDES